MIFDKKAMERLLSLNDSQLKAVLERLAAESGLDLSAFNVSPDDIASARVALSGASDSDLEQVAKKLAERKKGGRK